MIDGLIRKSPPARTHRTRAEAGSRAAVSIPKTYGGNSVVGSANDVDLDVHRLKALPVLYRHLDGGAKSFL
jgi:hypothetical protein